MKKGFIPKAALFALWMGIYACSATGEDKKPNEKIAQRPVVAVEVTKAAAATVIEGVEVIGTLSPKFGADVKSEYTGIVTEVYVTEWVQVEKGTPLARLDTREGELVLKKARTAVEIAKANLMQVEVAANRANREYERALKLKEVGLITQQNLDDARTEREAAAVRISAAKAQIRAAEEDVEYAQTRLSKAIIRSPTEGMVSWRNVNVGDYVGEMGAKPMFRMRVARVGQALTFSTDAIPGKAFTGKVMFINPTVNEADRSVKVVAEVDNRLGQLKGGLFVNGRILTGKRTGIIKIPRAALLSWDIPAKKAEIFVVQENVAHRRTVRTGNLSGEQVEIASGLAAGQLVITRGGFNVKDSDKVNVTRINGEK